MIVLFISFSSRLCCLLLKLFLLFLSFLSHLSFLLTSVSTDLTRTSTKQTSPPAPCTNHNPPATGDRKPSGDGRSPTAHEEMLKQLAPPKTIPYSRYHFCFFRCRRQKMRMFYGKSEQAYTYIRTSFNHC